MYYQELFWEHNEAAFEIVDCRSESGGLVPALNEMTDPAVSLVEELSVNIV
jgi:hypothetical protein